MSSHFRRSSQLFFQYQIALVIGKASEGFEKGGLIGYGDREIDVRILHILPSSCVLIMTTIGG